MLKPKSSQRNGCTHIQNKPNKFKQTSTRKLKATLFWERKGVLMVEFMQQGIIMSQVYCKTLKRLCRAIHNKRFGMMTTGVVLLHDNVRLHTHTAARTRALLEHFNWELFDHPTYSSHLAPSDCHLFTYLKNWLGSQRRNNNEELMECVAAWMSSKEADFLTQEYRNLLPDVTTASVPAMTTMRSSLTMYVFLYIMQFLQYCLFC
jgi:transposase